MKSLTKKIVIAALVALPILTLAQFGPTTQVPTTGVRQLEDISQIIVTIVNWLTGLFFVAAVLFLFYAAWLYLFAAGDPEKLKKAKNQLIYSVIAIAVALLAGSVRFVVENLLR